MKNTRSKVLLIILTLGFLTACNTVKRVAEDAHLLTEATLIVNDKKEKKEAVRNLIYQKPNSKLPLIDTPLRLHIYNLARPNIDSIITAKFLKHPKRKNRWERFLSTKQLNRYYQSRINFNKWIKRTGEAPVIINDTLNKKSIKRLESYYWNNGWFDVAANYITKKNDNKRAQVTYTIETGKPYYIDSLSTKIMSPVIDSLYELTKDKSLIQPNTQYKTATILKEKDRVTEVMRNNGVFHFSQDYFYFEMDSIGKTKKVNVDLQISNRETTQGDSSSFKPFNIYKVKDVNIYTNSTFENKNKTITDTTTYNGFKIYSIDELRYNPKTLTDAVFITPNSVFKDKNRPYTSRIISNLNTFKYPRIDYIENPDTTLTANIYLTPIKKFGLDLSGEVSQSNIQSVGFSFSPSLLFRNVFRGAETLEISGIASIGASKDGANDRDKLFDINEIGADLRLRIPRLFSPFNTAKIIPKSMFPTTLLSLAFTSQTNVGLDKQTFTGRINYKWFPNEKVTNRLDIFNIQFVKNLNIGNYFGVYKNTYNTLNDIATSAGYISGNNNLEYPNQTNAFINDVVNGNLSNPISNTDILTVKAINERKNRLTEDNLIFASNFSYVKDKRDNLFDNDFSILRLRFELAGNVLANVSKILGNKKNKNDRYEVFNVAFSQYIKSEIDYVKYWDLGNKNVLAMRSFLGIAIPYGNSSNIPFSKSFFAGGANDNRAWSPYDLGPGSLQSTNEFNEANLKVAYSIEQRFNISGPVNGALFIDAGNIWNVLDDVKDDRATFNSFASLKDIAIGSGFGLRYDFTFFILRGDIGFKTYDPSYPENNRWFTNYNFANAVYNIGINYPF
ncbi:BamA/TamA family outer membrane protein [Bizionia gelidisalsuginis]|uniref:BamA/TamA family outer membrane protein n=1 Tax=Bizionia gelidisalsuginis TaxID=291188 RepID=A0ABY3MA95_9FLAO|nr:BamA/TamA family outer membrane protein [Bizionia gelidisalsuginis]TYC12639.1 BamA/TamA family outer membrane protein [Bizionia gelidisalsuginis]